jgi:formylglycine-generating enzyme required for sulfatase activity
MEMWSLGGAVARRRVILTAAAAFLAAACAPAGGLSAEAQPPLPEVVAIPAGPFLSGSDQDERELAYRLDEAAYGHSRTRKAGWYDREYPKKRRDTAAYAITKTPISNRQYQAFVEASGHPVPDVEPQTWASYGLVHPYDRTRRHAWSEGLPPAGREDHPVVLVSHDDALAYAAWLTEVTGERWRLPDWLEWEKAVRGDEGKIFPWGDDWDPSRLNRHDQGPFDTLAVGSFPSGASPYGLLDGAGNIFEWTASDLGNRRFGVRGGSWDDSGCGVCRPAARHGRPAGLKHILIGFRLVREE